MGGSTSKAVAKIVNQAVTDVTSKNYIGCSSQTYQAQTAAQTNSGLSLFQKQTVTQSSSVSMSCLQSATKTTQLQTDLANTIKQAVESQSTALSVGSSTAEALTQMKNTIRNTITTENIVKMHNEVLQQQFATQTFSGVQIGGSQTVSQGTNVVVKAVQNLVEQTDIINKIANAIDQDAKSKQVGPFDFLADIFGSLAGAAIVFFIVIAILGYFFLRGGGFATLQSGGLLSGAPSLSGLLGARPNVPPAQNYVQPTPSAPLMTQNYATPAQNYAMPAQNYAMPAQNYATPAQNYATPAQNYVQPTPSAPSMTRNYASSIKDNHMPPSPAEIRAMQQRPTNRRQ